MSASVVALSVGDDADTWTSAGFTVDRHEVDLGGIRIRLDGGTARGVRGWTVLHPDHPPGAASLDGIPTTFVDELARPGASTHPNGTTAIDHIVLASSDVDRTTAALGAIGIEPRRTRDTLAGGAPLRQRFFRMGTIVELTGPPEPAAVELPATIWGLALVADDLDATARWFGDACTAPKDAVQPGRRIATVKTRDLGMSVPIALLSPHVR